MMKKFLENTADYVYSLHAEDLKDICIVLPNRRGGLFLKRYLSAAAGRTIWSPSVFSVEDFLLEISGIRIAGPVELLFELYEVHRSIEKEKMQSFGEFLSWGPQLLHDFDEADSYLAGVKSLFSFLNEAKAISLWNPDGSPLTEFERNYLNFFNSLNTYYDLLRERLTTNGIAYPGMMFRNVAERIGELAPGIRWKKILIAGMNAMTKSEEIIFDHLVKSGKAEFLWDSDHYYIDNDHQEAGDFLRKWMKKWPQKEYHWIGNDFLSGQKKIKITGVPDNVGQVKLCGQILSELLENNVLPEEVAIVLPDEQLLIPLLNSLPESAGEMNVTMGLPLTNTPLYTLIDLVFQMHLNVPRFQRPGQEELYRFYFRDVVKILQHPYIILLSGELMQGNYFALDDLTESVRSGGRIFYQKNELFNSGAGLFTQNLDFLQDLFTPWTNPDDANKCLKNLIEILREGLVTPKKNADETKISPVDLEYLFSFSLIISQLESLTTRFNSLTDIQTYYKLFLQIVSSTKLPFYGEPLRGIQIMGMLETRALDFKHIIVLSVNEGILPSARSNTSFIPFDIRRGFDLPTYLNNNSIYAYHFYRLLQRAEDIHLVYNTVGDDMGGGEKSRLISQLMNELPDANSGIKIGHTFLSTAPLPGVIPASIEIIKQGDVYVKLREKAASGFSPTSLNAYRQCPLRFYYQEIAGIRKPDDPADTVDSRILGLAVHEIFMNIYLPLKGQILTAEILRSRIAKIDELTKAAFLKSAKDVDITFGRNLLLSNVAKFLVKSWLNAEIERIGNGEVIRVEFLEEPVLRFIRVKSGNEDLEVRLKGFVDRIDSTNDTWRILDYKTGKVETKETVIKDWEDLLSNTDIDKSFQLVFYAFLFHQRISETGTSLETGIIPLKAIHDGIKLISVPGPAKKNTLLDSSSFDEFGKIVEKILSEIFDLSKPFVQTSDTDVCERCDYINLCSR